MKPTSRLTQGLAVAAVAVVSLSQVFAVSQPLALTTATVLKELRGLPNPELPARTANLVVKAQGADRDEQTALIVDTAVQLNPVAAPLIVSSVSRLSPDVAAVAASAAAKIEPQQMEAIVRAATLAAPGQAMKVLALLCKDHASQYKTIATSVAKAVPGMDRSIVTAVGEAVPNLKLFIGRSLETLTQQKDFAITVPAVLNQVATDLSNTSRALKSTPEQIISKGIPQTQYAQIPKPPGFPPVLPQPIVRPAFTPFDPNTLATKYFPSQTVPVTGGRNYSRPNP